MSSQNQQSGMNPNVHLGDIIQRDAEDVREFEMPKAVEAAHRVAGEIYLDDLTGLLNRKGFRLKLEESIRQGGEKAVIFIDLTNFKRVNDEAPKLHEAGNRVLRNVANVLSQSFRFYDGDVLSHERRYESNGEVGRIGGDEFAVSLDLTARTPEWAEKTTNERLRVVLDRLNDRFSIMKQENPELAQYSFDVAMGGALWQPGMDATTLLTRANKAMKANKAQQHAAKGKYR